MRWEPDGRGRLLDAAMELFAERGFDNTTVSEIAARAGLTERTFFRHYADKREVLFGGVGEMQIHLVDAVENAVADATPMDAVMDVLIAWGVMLQERREFAQRRAAVIAANAELRERELIKMANLATALADALKTRGVAAPIAALTAEAGVAVFRVAFERWVDDPQAPELPTLVRQSFDELKAVTAGE